MKDFIVSERGKIFYWIIGILLAFSFCMILFPPLFSLINKVEPFILGIPFLVFMEFIFGMFIALLLVLLYWVQKIRGEL